LQRLRPLGNGGQKLAGLFGRQAFAGLRNHAVGLLIRRIAVLRLALARLRLLLIWRLVILFALAALILILVILIR